MRDILSRPSSAFGICLWSAFVALSVLALCYIERSEVYTTSNFPFSLRRSAPHLEVATTISTSQAKDPPGIVQQLNDAHDVHPEQQKQEKEDKKEAQVQSHLQPIGKDLETEVTTEEGAIKDQMRNQNRLPLEDLVDLESQTVLQNVEFLLDFAIIAHPKTATSFLLDWLSLHPEVQAYPHEVYDLAHNRTADFVQTMYRLPPGDQYKRGYKAPRDIERSYVLDALRTYWPKARIIIGLRHPVRWFESFYNFRVRNGDTLPPADSPEFLQTPQCQGSITYGVCVIGSRFHHNLALLGKTNLSTAEERALVVDENALLHRGGAGKRIESVSDDAFGAGSIVHRNEHKVFLYETTQMEDSGVADTTSAISNSVDPDQFRHDISAFLNLRQPLQARQSGEQIVSASRANALDICQESYKQLRESLMKNAREASIWIRTYLLQSPDVVVSSREHFIALLQDWMYDPCET